LWDYAERGAHEYDGRIEGEGPILRIGRRTRAGLGLTLGVLVGLGLVILPGLLAPSNQTSTTSGSNNRVTASTQSAQPGSLNNQPKGALSGITVDSLLILVSLVLFPAIALAFLARYSTLNQAKSRLDSEN
jgi:membrane protease YdiL (CAAX protease family)